MGKIINQRYELLEKVGENEKLYIYKGRDLKTNRLVTVSVLRKKWLTDKTLLDFFNQELEVISSLDHPNICKIYDIDYVNNVYLVVSEYFEGISLFEAIEKEVYFSVLQSINITMQLGKVLLYAATQGVMNRNIKLTDILINKIGRIKVTAFSTPISKLKKTATGFLYKSTVNSDIFFLGFLLYSMIMGEFPGKMKGVIEIEESYLNGEFSWQLSRKNFSQKEIEELERIVQKATTKDVSQRFKRIEDMLKALDDFVKKHPHLLEVEIKNESEIDETQQVKDILTKGIEEEKEEDDERKKRIQQEIKEEEKLKEKLNLRFKKDDKKKNGSQLIWGRAPVEEEEKWWKFLFSPVVLVTLVLLSLIYVVFFVKF